MKPQDLIFVAIILTLLLFKKPKILIAAGLISLVLSIPLFYFWVFFTAQRLTYYAAGFFFAAVVTAFLQIRKH